VESVGGVRARPVRHHHPDSFPAASMGCVTSKSACAEPGACEIPATDRQDGNAKRKYFLGIDIGGTSLAVALLDDQGSFCTGPSIRDGADGSPEVWSEALGDDHDPRRVLNRLKKMAETALDADGKVMSDLSGIGVCTPGLMDVRAGIIKVAANIRGWQDLPVCDMVADIFGVERHLVTLEHDTNAALLAEVWIGAGRGRQDAALLTLGTGIGGALLCDGRLLRGSCGQAGEVGHMILMPDGRPFGTTSVAGIFEAYGSCTAVAERAAENGGPPSGSVLHRTGESADCAAIFKAARETGDAYALEVIDETARCLAIGCINICRTVDPSTILLAGGMSKAGEFLLQRVRDQFVKYHWNIEPPRVDIVTADLGQHSGVVGAARAAMLKP